MSFVLIKVEVKKDLQDRLDGIYTRLLMRAQNISWREHKTKTEIYDGIPQTSSILAQCRARFAGHYIQKLIWQCYAKKLGGQQMNIYTLITLKRL